MAVDEIQSGDGSGYRLAITSKGEALVRGSIVDGTSGAPAGVDSQGRLSTRPACVASAVHTASFLNIGVLPAVTTLANARDNRCGAVIQVTGANGILADFGGGDPTAQSFQIPAGGTFSLPGGTRHAIKAAANGGNTNVVIIDMVDE